MLSVEPSFFLLHPLSLSRVRVWFSDFKQPHFCLKLWKMPWHIWILSDAARGALEGGKLGPAAPNCWLTRGAAPGRAPRSDSESGAAKPRSVRRNRSPAVRPPPTPFRRPPRQSILTACAPGPHPYVIFVQPCRTGAVRTASAAHCKANPQPARGGTLQRLRLAAFHQDPYIGRDTPPSGQICVQLCSPPPSAHAFCAGAPAASSLQLHR